MPHFSEFTTTLLASEVEVGDEVFTHEGESIWVASPPVRIDNVVEFLGSTSRGYYPVIASVDYVFVAFDGVDGLFDI